VSCRGECNGDPACVDHERWKPRVGKAVTGRFGDVEYVGRVIAEEGRQLTVELDGDFCGGGVTHLTVVEQSEHVTCEVLS